MFPHTVYTICGLAALTPVAAYAGATPKMPYSMARVKFEFERGMYVEVGAALDVATGAGWAVAGARQAKTSPKSTLASSNRLTSFDYASLLKRSLAYPGLMLF
jgi:hypothetical protein